jgi:hypothetical protein
MSGSKNTSAAVTINAPTEMDASQDRRTVRYLHFAPWLAALVYLLLTASYSFMIPAWEANDELDHVANIQYEVEHFGSFMPIAYGQWHETHQPPLYYWIGAAWQRMLRIPAFTISFPPWRATKPENDKLVFAHNKFTTDSARAGPQIASDSSAFAGTRDRDGGDLLSPLPPLGFRLALCRQRHISRCFPSQVSNPLRRH